MMIPGQYVTFSIVRETARKRTEWNHIALAQLVALHKGWDEEKEQLARETLAEAFRILEIEAEQDSIVHHGKRG